MFAIAAAGAGASAEKQIEENTRLFIAFIHYSLTLSLYLLQSRMTDPRIKSE